MNVSVPSCDPTPPRYLFRAASRKSAGSSMPHKIVSAACSFPYCNVHGCVDKTEAKQCSMHGGLNEIPEVEAREMLDHHLGCPRESGKSEFTSWSCSLLTALVHAIRWQKRGEPSTTSVYVLDTRPIKNQVYKATDLIARYELKGKWDLMAMCRGEYLIHGVLQNPSDHSRSFFQDAKLEELINEGLFEQLPELRDHLICRTNLLMWTQNTRAELFVSEQSLSVDDVFWISELSRHFKGNFAFVFAMAFASIRRRDLIEDDRLHDLIESAGMGADTRVFSPWPESSIDATLLEATQLEGLLDKALDVEWSKRWDAKERKHRLVIATTPQA